MKKFSIVLALFVIAVVCCAGCIGPGDEPVDPVDPVVPVDPIDPVTPVDPVDPVVPVEEFSVMFMLNYGDAGAYTAETVKAGETISKPANPTRSGYTFKGWFTAAEGGAEYDFTQAVNADVTLYAQWKKKSSSGGHSHSYSWNIVKAANCTVDGQKQYVCSCGQVKSTEAIPATGHSNFRTQTNVTDSTAVDTVCGICNAVLFTTSSSNEIEIKTVEDLKNFAATVNAGNSYSGVTIKLVNALNLANEPWTPIGTLENKFKGTFDGQHHTISNLKISGSEYVGLFGYIDGYVKNVNVDSAIISGNHWVGTIVGYGQGGEISGCLVTNAEITVVPNEKSGGGYDNGDKVGGIVGYGGYGDGSSISNLKVTGCTVTDSTMTAFRDVGGIVGAAEAAGVTGNSVHGVTITVDKVTNSYANAAINGNPILGRTFGTGVLADQTATNWQVIVIYADGFQSVQTVSETYYEVSNLNGLKYFRDTVNAGTTYSGETIKLTADIDLNNEAWTPIGTETNKFQGTFDGQNHNIQKMTINTPDGEHLGFFGYTWNGAVIKDIEITDVSITGSWHVGTVVGSAINTQITNCDVSTVAITLKPVVVTSGYDNGDKAGGIVGYLEVYSGYGTASGGISNCHATDITITAYRDVGGIAGMINALRSPDSIAISGNTVSDITITVDQTTGFYGDENFNAGAIVGRIGGEGTKTVGDTGTAVITYRVKTTTGAQAALDTAGDGTTIRLAPGSYETLYLRQSVKKVDGVRVTDKSIYLPEKEVLGSYSSFYRLFKDVSIIGEDGANVDKIRVEASGTCTSLSSVDPNLRSYIAMRNVVFENINFITTGTGEYKDGFSLAYNTHIDIDGLTFRGCSYDDVTNTTFRMIYSPQQDFGNTLSVTTVSFKTQLKNVTITGCNLNGGNRAFEIDGVENLIVTDNTFTNMDYQPIHVAGSASSIKGKIEITTNTLIGSKDRAIRFATMTGVDSIVIRGNMITDCSDSNDEVMKSGEFDESKLTLESNSWIKDGVTYTDSQLQKEAGSATVWKYPSQP